MEKLRQQHQQQQQQQQQQQHLGGGDQIAGLALPHQMMIKREPAEPKLPQQYVFPGGSRSPYAPMASPSPQSHTPSMSPHSVGRTPSPMDYAGSVPHPYQGMHGGGILGYEQSSVTYSMPARHTDFMSAGKVTRNVTADTTRIGVIPGVNDLSNVGGGMGLFDNSPGMGHIAHNAIFSGMGANTLPGMASIGQNAVVSTSGSVMVNVGAQGMMAMNHMSLGQLGLVQGLGSNTAVSANLAPGLGLHGISVVGTSSNTPHPNIVQTMTDSNILDLDNQQQFSLDSGDLVSMGLIDPHLSESLSSNLTLSEKHQQQQQPQVKDVEPSENMTDSFTSLTKEISTLNDMCKGSGMRDHQ